MARYTNTLLNKNDKKFLEETKQKLIELGFRRASQSKIIKYGVEELKTKEFNSIVAGMQEKHII